MADLHYSESAEMYLKTLASLGGNADLVPIARVAEALGVSAVSANEMMQRLGRDDLVTHQPYRGVVLTPSGRQLAQDVIRRERLWERFLYDHLRLDWAEVHAWACQLEHATAPQVIEALDNFLKRPTTCPQGNPIPRRGSGPEAGALRSPRLSDLALGEPARITACEDESAEVLRYLQHRGLVPGAVVTVTEIAPRQGPLTVRVQAPGAEAAREHMLGTNLATTLRVARLAG